MLVHQIYTHSSLRNFSYLLVNEETQEAVCIDPFDGQQIENELADRDLRLKLIINTHEHWDHVAGNEQLISKFSIPCYSHPEIQKKISSVNETLSNGHIIPMGSDSDIQVVYTPGHTDNHLSLYLRQNRKIFAVCSGDTVFNAGVGNCRNGGNPKTLYHTVQDCYQALSDEVLLYPGHDYLENNLLFTLSIEQNNATAKEYLNKIQELSLKQEFLVTTLGLERKINTFFRLHSQSILNHLKQKGLLSSESAESLFVGLRKLRDQW